MLAAVVVPGIASAADVQVGVKTLSLASNSTELTTGNIMKGRYKVTTTVTVTKTTADNKGAVSGKITIGDNSAQNLPTIASSQAKGKTASQTYTSYVDLASAGKITTTVKPTNATCTISQTVELEFDFDKVYDNLIGKFNVLEAADVKAYSVYSNYDTQIAALKSQAVEYADAGGTKGSQTYSTYASSQTKLYNLFNGTDYDYTGLANLAFVKNYQTSVDNLLKTIKDAENAARSEAALEGYEAKKSELETVKAEVDAVDANAYGVGELTTNATWGYNKVKADFDAIKDAIDTKDEAYTSTGEVQDYSAIANFSTISVETLEEWIEKVTKNYTGYAADQQEFDGLDKSLADIDALVGVSDADKAALKTQKEAVESALSAYAAELTTNNEGYKYADGSATHTKSISDIKQLIADLNAAIEKAQEAYNKAKTAAETAQNGFQTRVDKAKADLDALQNDTQLGDYTGLKATALDAIKANEEDDYKTAYDAITTALGDGTLLDGDNVKTSLTTPLETATAAIEAISEEYLTKTNENKVAYTAAKAVVDEANAYYKEKVTDPYGAQDATDADVKAISDAIAQLASDIEAENNAFLASIDADVVKTHNYTDIKTLVDNLATKLKNAADNEQAQKDIAAQIETLTKNLDAAKTAIANLAKITDNGKTIYDASQYWDGTYDEIQALISAIAVPDGQTATEYKASTAYKNAVSNITTKTNTYKNDATSARTTFNTHWSEFTKLRTNYQNTTVISDFDEEYDAIGKEIEALKANILAVTNQKDAAHKTAVDALSKDNVDAIQTELDDLKTQSDIAKEAAEKLAARNAAKAAADNKLADAKTAIEKLDAAYGDGSNQGTTSKGTSLKSSYTTYKNLYNTLTTTYAGIASMNDEKATTAYNELVSKNGSDNDLTELLAALNDNTFEGYTDGLISALTQHAADVVKNDNALTTANNVISQLESYISSKKSAAETAVSGAENLTDANKTKGNSLISTAITAITKKVTTLRDNVTTNYNNETLAANWSKINTDENLRKEADAVVTKTNDWIADIQNFNTLTNLKAEVAQKAADSETTINTYAGQAKEHFNEIREGIVKNIASVAITAVPDGIITDSSARVLTDITAQKDKLNGYAADIEANEEAAKFNSTNHNNITAVYNDVVAELQLLDDAINGYDDQDTAEEIGRPFYDQYKDQLDAALDTIEANYIAGKYTTLADGSDYKTDEATLNSLKEAIDQAIKTFNEDFQNAVAEANATAKSDMEKSLDDALADLQNAKTTLNAYTELGETFNDIKAILNGFVLKTVDDVIAISEDITTHVTACNTANKLYKIGETGFDTDSIAIQAINDNIKQLETLAGQCNEKLVAAWSAINTANTFEADSADVAKFTDSNDANVTTKMTAAEQLLKSGNDAKTALDNAITAYNTADGRSAQMAAMTTVVEKAQALSACVTAYNNTSTGYAKLVADAKDLAAKSDLTNKVAAFRTNTVTPDQTAVNAGTYADGKTFEMTNERKAKLISLFGTVETNTIKAVENAVANTTFANYDTYKKDYFEALTKVGSSYFYTLVTLNSKIEEYVSEDNAAAATLAARTEYTQKLQDIYDADLALVAGSKVENNADVVSQFASMQNNIDNFGKATYASEAAVKAAYEEATTGTSAWTSGAINTATSKEKAALDADIAELKALYETYTTTPGVSLSDITTMKANIDALDTSKDFATLKGYEEKIAQYLSTMDKAVDGRSAEVLADFQGSLDEITISQDVIDFLGAEFGTDKYGKAITDATGYIATKKAEVEKAISDLQALLGTDENGGTKYNASNILFYEDDVQKQIDVVIAANDALTKLVTEDVNTTLGKTPKDAKADYEARKTANETAYTALSDSVAEVKQALADAKAEYSTINVDLTELDAVETDNTSLDLVELVSGKYQQKAKYADAIETATADIEAALQSARAADVNGVIAEKNLGTIEADVKAAINAKGLIGLAKANLEKEAETLAADYKTQKDAFDADVLAKSLTAEKVASYKQEIESIATKVQELIAKIDTYATPGDLGGNGDVDASDFTALKNIILSGQTIDNTTTPSLEQCDLNGDGKVSIGDLVMLNNIVLGLNPDGTEPASARGWFGNGESVTTELLSNEDGTKRIAINLSNSRDYVAFQMDVVLPEGMTIVGESLTDRARTQRLASNDLEDGTHRIITVPMLNTTFKGNEGAVLYLDVETDADYMGGDIELQNVIFSDVMGNDSQFQVNAGTVTAIKESLNAAGEYIMDKVYDLGGKVKNGLMKGINIIRRADGSSQKVVK